MEKICNKTVKNNKMRKIGTEIKKICNKTGKSKEMRKILKKMEKSATKWEKFATKLGNLQQNG